MGMRVLLVRHGETDWNVARRWQGQSGPGLNRRGQAQATAVAEHLATHEPTVRLVSSDLDRARETAEEIAAAVPGQLELDPRLREIDVGRWTGLSHEKVQAEAGDRPLGWSGDPTHPFGSTGESIADLRRRAAGWLAGLIDERGAGVAAEDAATVVAVTHGGFVRAAVAEILGLDDLEPLRGCGNASVTELRWSPSTQRWRLAAYNDTAHLRSLRHLELAEAERSA